MDKKSNRILLFFCLILPALILSPVFSSLCLAKKVTLGWDANPEPDLEGYVIYRNIESPGPPYKYADELLEDELQNPLNPQVTIIGLNEHTRYYIAVTAFDTQGNESYYSDQLCVEIVDSMIESCGVILSTGSSSSKSGGGGSGGGGGGQEACFISSAGGESGLGRVITGLVIFFGFVLMIFTCTKPGAERLHGWEAGKRRA
jgi:preprotein translocase subunit SecG